MLTVAITNESAARVRRVMFAAARRQITQSWLVGTLATAITSLIICRGIEWRSL